MPRFSLTCPRLPLSVRATLASAHRSAAPARTGQPITKSRSCDDIAKSGVARLPHARPAQLRPLHIPSSPSILTRHTSLKTFQSSSPPSIFTLSNPTPQPPPTPKMPPMLPSHALLARAFHRVAPAPTTHPNASRYLSTTAPMSAWPGSSGKDHVTNESDALNVQHDASRDGKNERAAGGEGNSRATSGQSGEQNQKAKKEHPEAPGPVIGMEDERGGKGRA